MVYSVKDLSADQRLAIESLLGRALSEEESVTIRPSLIRSHAPIGQERVRAFRRYRDHLDRLAERAREVPGETIDASIQEAIEHSRQRSG